MTPFRELPDRKRWARATSKRLKHSRAHRDLLAHLAYRGGKGEVWNYSLEELAEGSGVSARHVRRGLDLFALEGIITINRRGPKASQYILNLDVDISQRVDMASSQEWTWRQGRVDILGTENAQPNYNSKLEQPSPPPPPPSSANLKERINWEWRGVKKLLNREENENDDSDTTKENIGIHSRKLGILREDLEDDWASDQALSEEPQRFEGRRGGA